jgi:phage protein D
MYSQYYAPDFDVKINGLTIAADMRNAVIDLTYDNNIDTADMFTLRLNNADLRLTDSPILNVGNDVEIYMGYRGKLKPMMLGEITAVSPSFPQSGAPTVTVTGYDLSHRLRHNTPDRPTFKWVIDSAVVAALAAANGLIPVIDPVPLPPRESIQQTSSDWALIRELAERNYCDAYVFWDKLYFQLPRLQTKRVVLEWGKNLCSFTPRLSTAGKFGIQIIRGYDYKLCQKVLAVIPAIDLGGELDDIIERQGPEFIEQLVSLGQTVLRDQTVSNYVEAMALAKSVLKQMLDGLYEGSGSCIGLPELRAGDLVKIQGLGKRFSGNYRLSQVTHTINQGGYQTQFAVTQRATSTLLQSLRKRLLESPSPNKQDKIHDIVTGVVITNVDPMQLGRVQVSFHHLSELNLSAWARVSTPMAGTMAGVYFPFDIGDEVLVQFEGGDPDKPIIIGRSWNSCNPPPMPDPKNPLGANVIRTKGGNAITLSDTVAGEQIALENTRGSKITLGADGSITIKSATEIKLNAPTVKIMNPAGAGSTTITGNTITGAIGGEPG